MISTNYCLNEGGEEKKRKSTSLCLLFSKKPKKKKTFFSCVDKEKLIYLFNQEKNKCKENQVI